jgi:glycosyltransferase involved in cell wall biosynthesis
MRQANAQIYFQETLSLGTFLVAMFCRIYKRKFVYRTANQGEADGSHIELRRWTSKAMRWSLKHTAQVIVQNETDKSAIKNTTGINSMVIPNAHQLSSFSEDINKDIILWVGRSTKIKRPDLFVKLAAAVPQEHFVQICQEATDDKKYEELLAEAKQAQNLEFIKRVNFHDIDQFFQRAKIFINTSDSEGFPNTFVQACKNRTPILSLVVNPDNFLDKNKCGLCAEGNWQKFIDDVKLLSEPETAREYGQNGLEYVRKNHDIKIVVMEYKKLFENLTGFS